MRVRAFDPVHMRPGLPGTDTERMARRIEHDQIALRTEGLEFASGGPEFVQVSRNSDVNQVRRQPDSVLVSVPPRDGSMHGVGHRHPLTTKADVSAPREGNLRGITVSDTHPSV